MQATAAIDKLGRLVIPKKIREALHLFPGDALTLELRGEEVVMKPPKGALGLQQEDGLWVYDSGAPVSVDDMNQWIESARTGRIHAAPTERQEE